MPPPSCEPGATGTLTSALQAPPTHSGRRSPLIPCALAPPVYQAIGYAMPRSSCYCTLRANSRGERSVARLDTAQRWLAAWGIPDVQQAWTELSARPRRGLPGSAASGAASGTVGASSCADAAAGALEESWATVTGYSRHSILVASTTMMRSRPTRTSHAAGTVTSAGDAVAAGDAVSAGAAGGWTCAESGCAGASGGACRRSGRKLDVLRPDP